MTFPRPEHDQGRELVPASLNEAVEAAIATSGDSFAAYVTSNSAAYGPQATLPLAVKYVPTAHAHGYVGPSAGRLYIGANNYTWGRGVYVVGVEDCLSTAMYGRAGIVGRYDPAGWRAFDARDRANQRLYLAWLQFQAPYFDAMLTVHSGHWLNELRNRFREQFLIDVVLFHPDESDRFKWYTRPSDTWLAVSDWTSRGTLATGFSNRFDAARLTVLIEDEFTEDDPALTRTPQFALNPHPRPFTLAAHFIRYAYAHHGLVRVLA